MGNKLHRLLPQMASESSTEAIKPALRQLHSQVLTVKMLDFTQVPDATLPLLGKLFRLKDAVKSVSNGANCKMEEYMWCEVEISHQRLWAIFGVGTVEEI
ncbi:hypothetical protein chiPu_0001005 [Chiloscyllium punctatum]|uniref:Uncharacterized protein n=1 Tax=Chiloscyllium punctatum TaxID=137246 RepID=A0A401RWT7_CHIPU|nr:hypothetical protein [Chiloscyllium punctatum]